MLFLFQGETRPVALGTGLHKHKQKTYVIIQGITIQTLKKKQSNETLLRTM